MTKIKILLGLVFLFMASSAFSAEYSFYSVNYTCENTKCVQGDDITWDVTVENKGFEKMELIGVEIHDSYNDSTVSYYNISYYPTIDYRGEIISIWPKQEAKISIKDRVPPANTPSGFYYYLCFDNAVRTPRIVVGDVYNLKYCYNDQQLFLPMVDCVHSDTCRKDEYCGTNTCKKIKCNECEFIVNHRCVEYQCCKSDDCGLNQECVNNVCGRLDCAENEFLYNHTCKELNCEEDEGYFNHKCVTLNCDEVEHIVNHNCEKLNCTGDEFIKDHSCFSLNCSENEYLINQSCNKLSCRYNEGYFNHTCVTLSCGWYQKVLNHNCVNDRILITKLGVEAFIVILILVLIILDIREYEIHRKPKDKLINKTPK